MNVRERKHCPQVLNLKLGGAFGFDRSIKSHDQIATDPYLKLKPELDNVLNLFVTLRN